jgi:hypothetical protein
MMTIESMAFFSGKTKYCAWAPHPKTPPNPMILSPGLKAFTAEPVDSTSPVKSDPIIDSRGLKKSCKNMHEQRFTGKTWQSLLFTVLACTLISTSFSAEQFIQLQYRQIPW